MYCKKEPKVISMMSLAKDHERRQRSRRLHALNLEPVRGDPAIIRLRQARAARAQYARERAMMDESSDEAVHGSEDDTQLIIERTLIVNVP